jgi:uncharacterized protein YyaL (SSP411 family)
MMARFNCARFYSFIVLSACFYVPFALSASLNNQLNNHASPYLMLHAEDPVHWQDWDESVLEFARQHNRMIYLSSGYFSCHWCHVMQSESFRNTAIARLLNEYFVPVKIDRELVPALDEYLIKFVRQSQGIAGWPLNVFLTPEGYPLFGTVYQPPEAFESLLNKLVSTWSSQADKATRLAREAVEYQLQFNQPLSTADISKQAFINKLTKQLAVISDDLQGGFGEQSRFPKAPQLLVMLELYATTQDIRLREHLVLTLDEMKNKGLRDHINGGFFRYTVDPGWIEPHYEKMLYTQALLVQVYLKAGDVFQRQDYYQVAKDTMDFVIREMQSEPGGYVSSFSALDDQDIEGGAYLWNQKRLSEVLTPAELALVNQYWLLQPLQKTREGQLPKLADAVVEDDVLNELRNIKTKLRSLGRIKTVPVDDKVITSWNALLLSSLSLMADKYKDQQYQALAKQLRNYLLDHHWVEAVLRRTHADDGLSSKAHLEDYVYMAKALRDFAVLSSSEEDWYLSNLMQSKAWLLFRHNKGWKGEKNSLLPGMQAQSALTDSALPAADALLMALSLTSDNTALKQKALQAAGYMYPNVMQKPFEKASHYHWIKAYGSKEPSL